jgi:hypoxanthine phosphoribosyltransferase
VTGSQRPPPPAGEGVEVLVEPAALAARVGELGAEIAAVYAGGRAAPPLAIGILRGSTPFLADLVRAMDIDVEVDFMSISSYGGEARSSGVVRILKDLESDIAGRDVLVVEDIVDTGLTLAYLRRALGARAPRSVRAAALLDKRARRIVPVPLEHVGFEIPDVFVVGYGLDWHGRWRNLAHVVAVPEPEVAAEAELERYLGAWPRPARGPRGAAT